MFDGKYEWMDHTIMQQMLICIYSEKHMQEYNKRQNEYTGNKRQRTKSD